MSSIEDLFGKLAMTTVTTVSRIALSHATNAAIRNVTSYITTQIPKNKPDSKDISSLNRQLDLKVKNLKPTIDIIARSVADGNQDLEPALEMCNDLKSDIDDFATQVNTIKDPEQVKAYLKRLLTNLDDAIPSLHLALRSIENKTGKNTVSPSKLVQASSILLGLQQGQFKVKLYSLFSANARAASAEAFTWKEEYHKCDLTVVSKTKKEKGEEEKRDYGLKIVEDLDDGLYHEEGEGKQELHIDINHIKRMYYTQSGELLNIDDSKSPVLVMKVLKKEDSKTKEEEEKVVEVKESAPEIVKEELQEFDWYAIGLWTEEEEPEDDDESDSENSTAAEKKSSKSVSRPKAAAITGVPMNLLLLESVIKLALLEISEQMNHLHASDELIALYMK